MTDAVGNHAAPNQAMLCYVIRSLSEITFPLDMGMEDGREGGWMDSCQTRTALLLLL